MSVSDREPTEGSLEVQMYGWAFDVPTPENDAQRRLVEQAGLEVSGQLSDDDESGVAVALRDLGYCLTAKAKGSDPNAERLHDLVGDSMQKLGELCGVDVKLHTRGFYNAALAGPQPLPTESNDDRPTLAELQEARAEIDVAIKDVIGAMDAADRYIANQNGGQS